MLDETEGSYGGTSDDVMNRVRKRGAYHPSETETNDEVATRTTQVATSLRDFLARHAATTSRTADGYTDQPIVFTDAICRFLTDQQILNRSRTVGELIHLKTHHLRLR